MDHKIKELAETIDFGKSETEEGVLEAFSFVEEIIEEFGKSATGKTIINCIDKRFLAISDIFCPTTRARAFNNTFKLLAILLTEYDNR